MTVTYNFVEKSNPCVPSIRRSLPAVLGVERKSNDITGFGRAAMILRARFLLRIFCKKR
jgi:hypothetical protein